MLSDNLTNNLTGNDTVPPQTPSSIAEQHFAQILVQMTANAKKPDLRLLEQLIFRLQLDGVDEHHANQNMATFIYYLRDHPVLMQGFTLFLLNLIDQNRQVSLYTDAGILSDNSFFAEFHSLIGHRFLPRLPEEYSLFELISRVFSSKKDRIWLENINNRWWYELVLLFDVPPHNEALLNRLKDNILTAIVILSYRISGLGLHPELIRNYPQAMEVHSAFVAQNFEVNEYVNLYRKTYLEKPLNKPNPDDPQTPTLPLPPVDASQIYVLLDQGQDIAHNIRKRVYKTGISIRLTNMLVRLEQSLERLELLIQLVSLDKHEQKKSLLQLMNAFIAGAQNRNSLGYLIGVNTELLSRKVTENASKVGEHYISTDSKGYREMYKKGAIGGLLIGAMATLKILGYHLELAPMGRAFLNSMIYGLGFVLIHIIGGTVATKQPAMTAAAIASTISEVTTKLSTNATAKKLNKLSKLAELIVDILRTQFIAIMGNITIAMPIALLISVAYLHGTGHPLTDLHASEHLLHDLNPFTSLALPHAAIAGVYLYISGLIAGYYDNMAVYNKIGERLRRHPTLKLIFPADVLIRMSEFIESNLGALMSNFIFGIFLGTTATIGYMFGLPLDIRHIAFSSANFIHGVFNVYANTGSLPDLGVIVISFLGVLMIGSVNLMVSFALALFTALRARGVEWFEWKSLFEMVKLHFANHPSDFFVPRKQPMQYARIDSNGNIIYDEKIPPQESKQKSTKESLTLPIGTGVLKTGEKLSETEIQEKKQAMKEKSAEKTNPSDTATKLPK